MACQIAGSIRVEEINGNADVCHPSPTLRENELLETRTMRAVGPAAELATRLQLGMMDEAFSLATPGCSSKDMPCYVVSQDVESRHRSKAESSLCRRWSRSESSSTTEFGLQLTTCEWRQRIVFGTD